ncbi:efflux RND transporter periplasmic adaptor subunit [Mesorhizobium amorphae]|uniref:RND family efflux transporter MFP subunit n=1 Tax=Mesorhizobium amorphae CCNWGS0123 TaxID=1082933 RepID=G6YCE6_9HYPH|nr:efflux RND transporter periplasmic adaptor subunit [Mesorhizobium amorphae]EHH10625.1 RND family efflux transporter MFP subunit [Mesorhizobium amorphae CCNWGS0123]GLR41468.1 transport system membrane protein [Mesorhizobium amorphae]
MDDEIDKRLPLPSVEATQRVKPRRRRGWIVMLLLLAAAGGLAVWLHPFSRPQQTAEEGRGGRSGRSRLTPQPVAVAPVATGSIPIVFDALGTVTSLSTVTVRPQVSGQITQIALTEGQMVRKGDFLAQIDDRNFVASLHQLTGQLKHDQALLDDARLDLNRDEKLTTNAITIQAVDLQRATVEADEGTVASDQAQIEAVQLNISNSHIVAPADGRLGLRQVDTGNYVTPGDANGIVVITQMQPISVMFSLPEDNLAAVTEEMRNGATLPVTLFDRDDVQQIASGTLQTVDNQIDPTTGTVKMRAIFANTDQALFPNQFVNAHLLVRTLSNVMVVPNAAIQHGAPGTFVYVVGADDTVSVRPIATGPGDATATQVLSGLSLGDKVVVDGVDRLKDGAKVTVPDAATPAIAPSATAPAAGQAPVAGQAPAAPTAGQPPAQGAPPAATNAPGAQQRHHRHRKNGAGGGTGAGGSGDAGGDNG